MREAALARKQPRNDETTEMWRRQAGDAFKNIGGAVMDSCVVSNVGGLLTNTVSAASPSVAYVASNLVR